jgi:hypothetical protein
MRWLGCWIFILGGFGAKKYSNDLNAVFGMKLLAESSCFAVETVRFVNWTFWTFWTFGHFGRFGRFGHF